MFSIVFAQLAYSPKTHPIEKSKILYLPVPLLGQKRLLHLARPVENHKRSK